MPADEGPVYYREIQKNSYLKRLPSETGKLRPLQKKPPLRAMWTQFCVHNGRSPYLEQYTDSDAAANHRPIWRASLAAARHVTASVQPWASGQYDFLVHTDGGGLRMLAPDWDTMQDWVTCLRTRLIELRIITRGDNVYSAPPLPPPARAPARDPTSPLPAPPHPPPDRLPGVEIIRPQTETEPQLQTTPQTTTQPATMAQQTLNMAQPMTIAQPMTMAQQPMTMTQQPMTMAQQPMTMTQQPITMPQPITETEVDISHWDPQPSTSQEVAENRTEVTKGVKKICGQNICLDNSVLRRREEEFKVEEFEKEEFTQRMVVEEERSEPTPTPTPTNITVIQVSNKAPHTAIPVLGKETIFNFDLKRQHSNDFVNIVNTEEENNKYGAVFSHDCVQLSTKLENCAKFSDKPENTTKGCENSATVSVCDNNAEIKANSVNVSVVPDNSVIVSDNSDVINGNVEGDYGHLSLTTTVNLTGDSEVDTDVKVTAVNNEDVYERLCLASTSNVTPESPNAGRKVSNLEIKHNDIESPYECVFPKDIGPSINNGDPITVTRDVTVRMVTDAVNTRLIPNSGQNNTSVTVTNNGDSVEVIPDIIRNVERSRSQNSYDRNGMRDQLIQKNSQKLEGKNECTGAGVWRRGLTELALLGRLRRRASPHAANNIDNGENNPPPPGSPPPRCRRRGGDDTRRRSNSLSNGTPRPAETPLLPLVPRLAAALAGEVRRGAAAAAAVSQRDPPGFVDYDQQVWISSWGVWSRRADGRAGDRVAGVAGAAVASAHKARKAVLRAPKGMVDIVFHRVPLAKIYVIHKRDLESIGLHIDNEFVISSVRANSPAARAGLPPANGRWALTEVNGRPLDLKEGVGADATLSMLSLHGTEVSLLLQPAALVRRIRAALKGRGGMLWR